MRGFLLGFVCAALVAAATYWFGIKPVEPDPCRACSTGTRCAAGLCVAASTTPQPVAKKRPGVRRPGTGSSGTTATAASPTSPGGEPSAPVDDTPPPPPPPPLRPEDKKLVSAGDKLTGIETLNLAEAGGSDRELSQEDLDAIFRPHQAEIIGCIDEARGEAQLDGQITVAFRVQRAGRVSGVRIEAPNYLVEHGLLKCVRGIVQGLSFPPSSRAQVVTYPFVLR